MPARVEVDHQVHAGLFSGVHHRARVGDGRRQRLFDHHVLAGSQHCHGRLAVQVVRRRDRHSIDGRSQLLRAGGPRAAEPFGCGPRTRFVAIADHRDRTAWMRGQREGVIVSPDTGADDANPHE